MEDLFIVAVVLLIYAAVAWPAKKKGARRRGKNPRRARQTQFERAFEADSGEKRDVKQEQEALRKAAAAKMQRREPGCETSRIHLHEVTQAQMNTAAEGEDPCHGGHAPQRAQDADFLPEAELEPNALAQDVLRGVIMSEILQRPCERRKRSGWSSYGR